MNFVDYVRTLKRYWLLIIISALVVATIATVAGSVGTKHYASSSRIVIGPAASIDTNSDLADALSALDRRSIASTFAEVAASDRLRDQAARAADISSPGKYSTSAVVLAQANSVQITVEGTNKTRTKELAEALTLQSERFFEDLYRLYEVEPIDPAGSAKDTSQSPVALALVGVVVGAAIGFLLALAAQSLRKEAVSAAQLP